MSMLLGLKGTSRPIGLQSVAVVDARSVVAGPHGPLLDKQGVPYEDPRPMVVTFGAINAVGGAVGSVQAIIEWGTDGTQHRVGPFQFGGGSQVPVKGSWVRVILDDAGVADGYQGSVSLSYGEVSTPPVVRLGNSFNIAPAASQGWSIPAAFVAGDDPIANGAFITALRVIQGADAGGNQAPLIVGIPGLTGDEVYNLAAGATDVWHDVGTGQLGQQFQRIVVQNASPAIDAFITIQAKLSL